MEDTGQSFTGMGAVTAMLLTCDFQQSCWLWISVHSRLRFRWEVDGTWEGLESELRVGLFALHE